MTKIESASFNWYNNQYTITWCVMCVHVCKSVRRSVHRCCGCGHLCMHNACVYVHPYVHGIICASLAC